MSKFVYMVEMELEVDSDTVTAEDLASAVEQWFDENVVEAVSVDVVEIIPFDDDDEEIEELD